MKNIFNFLKICLKKILPESMLNFLKKNRYYNTVKNFRIEREPDLNLSKNLINEGDTIIDVGANIGIYTKYMSEFVGRNGRVFSFEPINITFRFLNNNIKLLKLNNVQSYNYALSDKNDEKIMIIPSVIAGENYFRATITENESEMGSSRNFRVKSIPMDEILDNKIKYSFIKIDVEGHEEKVLKGGKNIIEYSKPILLIEIDGDLADKTNSAGRVNQFLIDLGYTTFVNYNQKLRRWKEGIYSINYFYIHRDSLEQLNKKNIFI